MKNSIKTALAVTVMTAIAIPVLADGHKSHKGKLGHAMGMAVFQEMDTDNNQSVSHGEVMARVSEKFVKFDNNGDGLITLDELPKVMPVPEHKQNMQNKLKQEMLDRLREKGLSEEEIAKKVAKMDKRMQGRTPPTRIEFMNKHDQNKDEAIDLSEFGSRMIKKFKKMDVNGDGSVTVDELKTAQIHKHKNKKEHKSKHQ